MRQEGLDPLEGYKPGYNRPRNNWEPLEAVRLHDGADPAAWSELAAQVKEMEARHPRLSNREILIEELTDRWISTIKTNNLFLSHSRSQYRSCIASLMFQHAHPLLAGFIFSLVHENFSDQNQGKSFKINQT